MQILFLFIEAFLIFNVVIMGLASFSTWVERKGSALIQDRIGANRAGAYTQVDDLLFGYREKLPAFLRVPLSIALWPVALGIRVAGILGIINTLLCDAVKALFKEDFVPEGISNFMHCLAPFMAVFPVFVAFAVIPFAPDFTIGDTVYRIQLAPINAGVLFVLAMGSVAVYGVALAGWTSNNKFAVLGALRAAAQMISYELAMGITFVAMIVTYQTLDLYKMIEAQNVWWRYGIICQPLSFIILFIVGMAETKRAPFDLPEAESELVAGYFTEYSGMKFLIFWLGEFAEIGLFALLLSILFLGGWNLPGLHLEAGSWLTALIGFVILMVKVSILCVIQIVIRWTLPRFRYDQLMSLGWKILLPLSLVNLLVTAAVTLSF